jgi:hypothetical protein
VSYTSAGDFWQLRWCREQLEQNPYGFHPATLAYLLERQTVLETSAVEENIRLDLNGAIGRRGDALGAFLTAGQRLQRHRENEVLRAQGWRLPWDGYRDGKGLAS